MRVKLQVSVTTGTPKHSGTPCAMVLRTTRLRRPHRRHTSRNAIRVHRKPNSRVVTFAKRPSRLSRVAGKMEQFPKKRKKNIFARRAGQPDSKLAGALLGGLM